MKKRTLISLIVSLALTLPLLLSGCAKTTGGGSFYDEANGTGDFYTLGFNAQPVGEPSEEPIVTLNIGSEEEPEYVYFYQQDAKGQLSLVNHTEGFKVKVTFDNTLDFALPPEVSPGEIPVSLFFGPATVKTQGMENDISGTYSVIALFEDYSSESEPDAVELLIGQGDALAFLTAYLQDPTNFNPYNFAEFTLSFVAGGPLEPGSDIVVH